MGRYSQESHAVQSSTVTDWNETCYKREKLIDDENKELKCIEFCCAVANKAQTINNNVDYKARDMFCGPFLVNN